MDARRLGGYELRDKLGEGGMGAVYLAHDPTLDRPAAIKVIRAAALTREGKERFLREARACSRINHPNIITVYAAGEENGTPYMAMELVDGRTLRDIMREGPVAWRTATVWIAQLLDALQRLHGEGIVHRDLKPENIMVTRDGTIKLMDFGVAHLSNETALTQEGTTLGTAPYMSPEQVMGKRPDPRSDLFSLITIYHEMVMGSHPFAGDNAMAVMFAIKTEPPHPFAPRDSDFPKAIRAVVAQAFEKEPEKRYPDAKSLRDAIAAVVPEVGRGASVSRINPRHLIVFALVAAVVVAAGVIGWNEFQSRRASADRTAAQNLNEIGDAKDDTGDIAGAEEAYRLAIQRDPRYAVPFNNLGILALKEGDVAEADSMFREAIERDPRYSAALINLGNLYIDSRADSAEALFRRAIQGDDPAPAGNQLGYLMLNDGRLDGARATLQSALASPTSDAVRGLILRNLGKVEAARGDSLAARTHWQEASTLLPNDPELRSLLSH
jgi:Tfp pilus assembly protein PilF/predicted Ser/Thr protein kinase